MPSFGGRSFSLSNPYGNMAQGMNAQNHFITAAGQARDTGYQQAIDQWNKTFSPYETGYGQNGDMSFGGANTQRWDALLKDPNSITSNPGYEFARNQGQQGIENSAAARGGLLSGNALRAVTGYNQDYASNQYDKALGRYQNAAQFGATVDTNYANALANLNVNRGLSNAQTQGDFSNYAFWHEQQGMDEAKQWLGALRGMTMGGAGGSKSTKTQPSIMGSNAQGTGTGVNSFLSYSNPNQTTSNPTYSSQVQNYPTDASGNIDWNAYFQNSSGNLNYGDY